MLKVEEVFRDNFGIIYGGIMKCKTSSQIALKEYLNQEFKEVKEYANQNEFFEFFCSKLILKNLDLSDEEIEKGLIGGANDGGCDAIYVLLDNSYLTEDVLEDIDETRDYAINLHIIQTKCESSFSEDALQNWKTVAQNLLDIGKDKQDNRRYNKDLLNTFSLFKGLYLKIIRQIRKLNISFYYASFASEVHPNVQAQANELKEIVQGIYPNALTDVKVEFWGAEQLLRAAQKPKIQNLELELAEPAINVGRHKDYVALVNLSKYYRFITDENGNIRKSIFEANIRDYQGHNSVNQDIEKTLSNSSGEDFWWLNNGVTVLTDGATAATSKLMLLKDPEVVNGLQTSNEIYQYFQSNPGKLNEENRNILVRIIVPESEESRDRIILATNNQTNIPKSSLRASDPIHWQIEQYFKNRGLFYDRRKNYYKNQGKKSNEIISVSFLAQCMISLLLQQPNYARARPSTLLTQEETYDKLYSKCQDLEVFYRAAKLGRDIQLVLKKSNVYKPSQINDILFYVLYYSVAKKIQKQTIVESDLKLIDLELFTDKYILDTAKEVFDQYSKLGENGSVAKGGELIETLRFLISIL